MRAIAEGFLVEQDLLERAHKYRNIESIDQSRNGGLNVYVT